MPCHYSENPDQKSVEIVVEGRVTQDDMEAILPKMQAFIDTHGTVKMVEVVKDFGGFDPSVIWPGIQFDIKNLRHISHVAIVSDIGWISPISKAAGAVMSTRLRTFDMAELEDARAWIREPGV
jgi:hypothetical protein